MKHNPRNRIIELILKRSKRNPAFCHVIAVMAACKHKENLGLCKTPGEMVRENLTMMRTDRVKIWKPEVYEIYDAIHCLQCPDKDLWLRDLPRMDELEKDDLDWDGGEE